MSPAASAETAEMKADDFCNFAGASAFFASQFLGGYPL